MTGREHSQVALAYTAHWKLGPGERAALLGLGIVQDLELRPWVRPMTLARHLGMTLDNAADMLNRPRLQQVIEKQKVPFENGTGYNAYRIRVDWRPGKDE